MKADSFASVKCYYTGGGIWVYSAKYKDCYLYGSLDQCLGCYSISGEEIEDKHGSDYDSFTAKPDGGFPTWGDIANSLATHLKGHPNLDEMLEALEYYNPNKNVEVSQ